jgi:endonuclease G
VATDESQSDRLADEDSQGSDGEMPMQALRHYVRTTGRKYLDDPNISSIGIGYKITDGVRTDEISVQFTVKTKHEDLAAVGPEALDTAVIPEMIEVAGVEIPTDVIERDFKVSYTLVEAEETNQRKLRIDPIRPGASVAHEAGTAGTIGMIVFDRQSGEPCVLSNWHVLHRGGGNIGDRVVQPGPHDDNNVDQNGCGQLVRSHLGDAGDCAIARIEGRGFDRAIVDIDVVPEAIVHVELGDRVVKSGRTTAVTHGVVRRVDVMAKISYHGVGEVNIGGFEIGPPDDVGSDYEVSLGGDSGAVWMLLDDDGVSTSLLAGLHFAGETSSNPDEHALSCYARSVFKKLNISLTPIVADELQDASLGYDPGFVTEEVNPPRLSADHLADVIGVDGSPMLDYTHYSVWFSAQRGFARLVAWNIDGGRIKRVSRNGRDFKKDQRINRDLQHGDFLYDNNPLDKGHIARRADLTWGSLPEAERANEESFFFTNCVPQHRAFNRSNLGGLWGRLENSIFEDVDVEDLRVSVMGGPIFSNNDPAHRGIPVPRDFWKLVAYRDTADGVFKVRAYILTQRDLLTDIEALELDPFQMFQVPLHRLQDETGLDFSVLDHFDTFAVAVGPEAVGVVASATARSVASPEELFT